MNWSSSLWPPSARALHSSVMERRIGAHDRLRQKPWLTLQNWPSPALWQPRHQSPMTSQRRRRCSSQMARRHHEELQGWWWVFVPFLSWHLSNHAPPPLHGALPTRSSPFPWPSDCSAWAWCGALHCSTVSPATLPKGWCSCQLHGSPRWGLGGGRPSPTTGAFRPATVHSEHSASNSKCQYDMK